MATISLTSSGLQLSSGLIGYPMSVSNVYSTLAGTWVWFSVCYYNSKTYVTCGTGSKPSHYLSTYNSAGIFAIRVA